MTLWFVMLSVVPVIFSGEPVEVLPESRVGRDQPTDLGGSSIVLASEDQRRELASLPKSARPLSYRRNTCSASSALTVDL